MAGALICRKPLKFVGQELVWNAIIELVKMLAGTWCTVGGVLVTGAAVIGGVLKSRLIVNSSNRISVWIDELLAISRALEVNCTAKCTCQNGIFSAGTLGTDYLSSEGIAENFAL